MYANVPQYLNKAMQIETLMDYRFSPSINNVKPQEMSRKPTGTYLSNSAANSGNCRMEDFKDYNSWQFIALVL